MSWNKERMTWDRDASKGDSLEWSLAWDSVIQFLCIVTDLVGKNVRTFLIRHQMHHPLRSKSLYAFDTR